MKKIDTLIPVALGLFVFDLFYRQGWMPTASKEVVWAVLGVSLSVPVILFIFKRGPWFAIFTFLGVPCAMWAFWHIPKVPVTKYEPIAFVLGLVLGVIWMFCLPTADD